MESRVDLLRRMAVRIELAVFDENTPPRDLAALTKRLADITKEIETLTAAAEQEGSESEVPGDEAFDPATA